MAEALNQRGVGSAVLRYGVLSSRKLDAPDGSRAFGDGIDGNAGVRSLRRSWCDSWIVVIEAERYWAIWDVVAFGPINQIVPDAIVFGERRRNLGVGSDVQNGQEVRGTERFEFYFRESTTIATEGTVGLKPADLQDFGVFAAVARRGAKVSAEGARKRLVIFEADGEADIEDGFVGDLKLVGGLFEAKSVDVFLRRFAHRTGKQPLEVKRGVAVFRGQRVQIQLSIQILLDVHEQWNHLLGRD